MKKKLNLKKEICFDDKPENTNILKEISSAAILQRVEQEFNGSSLVRKKNIKVEIVYKSSFPDGFQIKISPDDKKKAPPPKILLFGWKRSPELLTQMMEEIHDHVQIFADRSMVDVFVRMATSKDLSQESKKMYIACKTNLFGYIVDRLKPYFKSFNPTTVERCELFVSKLGNSITANSLYNKTTENLQERISIDRILKKYL